MHAREIGNLAPLWPLCYSCEVLDSSTVHRSRPRRCCFVQEAMRLKCIFTRNPPESASSEMRRNKQHRGDCHGDRRLSCTPLSPPRDSEVAMRTTQKESASKVHQLQCTNTLPLRFQPELQSVKVHKVDAETNSHPAGQQTGQSRPADRRQKAIGKRLLTWSNILMRLHRLPSSIEKASDARDQSSTLCN